MEVSLRRRRQRSSRDRQSCLASLSGANATGMFNLAKKDLSALPLLGRCVMELLEELPGRTTGLGATEMRLLELIGAGYSLTNGLFYRSSLRQRRVFEKRELGYLIE